MNLTKKDFIQELYKIEEKKNISLGREVQRVIRNEIIPIEVIKLINKYDKKFLKIYDTFNVIYLSRFKNPLYRNLKNKDLELDKKVIALSSLVTKILISSSKISDLEERHAFVNTLDIKSINKAIEEYMLINNTELITEQSNQVCELLYLLYID
nr:MAG TPA: hypothetical protein [Caudoviricetes sp.]